MDIRKIKKLIELLEESGLAELEISEGEESVRIARFPKNATAAPPGMPAAPRGPGAAGNARSPAGTGCADQYAGGRRFVPDNDTGRTARRKPGHGTDGRHLLRLAGPGGQAFCRGRTG